MILEVVEDLGAHSDRLREGGSADRHDHEFLEVDIVVRVRAAVDDVHHRHGQNVGVEAADITEQRQAMSLGRGSGDRQETPRIALAPSFALFLVPSMPMHHRVDLRLLVASLPTSAGAIFC